MTYATDVSPIVFDLETAGLPNATDFLEPLEADKRLTDPAKIAASIAEREQARAEKFGLDYNVGRIVALGYWTDQGGIHTDAMRGEAAEADLLRHFWSMAKHRTIIGFRIKDFDLKFAIQRSRYLGIEYPQLDLGRYSTRSAIVDLYHELTFNDSQDRDSWCMRRTLKAFSKRFGLPCEDETAGADIAALVAADQWDQVIAHCTSDVKLTVALAQRLGFVQTAQAELVF